MPFKVGLTGGIASGKSTIAELFAQHDVPVIDADIIARELVEPGTACLGQIVRQFGGTLLNSDGTLNRRQLRQRIFNDDQARTQLNQIMHPAIRKAMLKQVEECTAPYCLLVIPLLLESEMQDLVDRILVVDCPRQQQLSRLMHRDKIDRDLAESMLASQLDAEFRLQAADDIIDNSAMADKLTQQVADLHQRYLGLSQAC